MKKNLNLMREKYPDMKKIDFFHYLLDLSMI